jgi:hypothetical protein
MYLCTNCSAFQERNKPPETCLEANQHLRQASIRVVQNAARRNQQQLTIVGVTILEFEVSSELEMFGW